MREQVIVAHARTCGLFIVEHAMLTRRQGFGVKLWQSMGQQETTKEAAPTGTW